jgi:alanine racemase
MISTRPIRATISVAAAKHNLGVAKSLAGASRIFAIIKANAYGHGLLRMAGALQAADGFGVVDLNDAVRLREAGFDHAILLLNGFFTPEELRYLAEYNLMAVVHTPAQIELLERAGTSPIDTMLKLNTGMNRLGFAPTDWKSALARLQRSQAVKSIMLMTHFARAEEPGGVDAQLAVFVAETVATHLPICLANSAALITSKAALGDYVRPGLLLYGCSPVPTKTAAELDLQPVMTLRSAIIGVQQLQRGDAVGYGGTFVAEKAMRIGTVACGYADGYPRACPSGTPVLVGNTRTSLVGRVSMDLLAVDISALPTADVGTPVTLWGEGLPVEEIAASAGKIPYELLCALSARVPIVEGA